MSVPMAIKAVCNADQIAGLLATEELWICAERAVRQLHLGRGANPRAGLNPGARQGFSWESLRGGTEAIEWL